MIDQHVAQSFGLPAGIVKQVGTTVVAEAGRSFVVLWPAGKHVIAAVPEEYADTILGIIRDDKHVLTMDDLKALWDEVEETHTVLHVLDGVRFKPAPPPNEFTVRPLDEGDAKAFDTFLAKCSEEDRSEGEVGLGDDLIWGALDKKRIVAAASTFELRGMVDVGVLVDPAYRGNGLGKAVVSMIIEQYMDDPRFVMYRVDVENTISLRLAKSLGLVQWGTLDGLRPISD